MFNISPLEMMVLLVIALIVLGPQRLPDVARSVGKGMREFRTALASAGEDDDDDDIDNDDERDEPPQPAKPPASELPEGS